MNRHGFGAARAAALFATLLIALAFASSRAWAASISMTPAAQVVNCATAGCATITVQVNLLLGENDADSFSFDVDVVNPGALGYSFAANAGFGGSIGFLDGDTIRFLLDSVGEVPPSYDGIATIDVATIYINGITPGTTEFRFAESEIACSTCNLGAGQTFGSQNLPNQLLAVVQNQATAPVPEPASLGLLAAGLLALGRRPGYRAGRGRGAS
jgi:hypothetical protein